jgi:hypothetical protein
MGNSAFQVAYCRATSTPKPSHIVKLYRELTSKTRLQIVGSGRGLLTNGRSLDEGPIPTYLINVSGTDPPGAHRALSPIMMARETPQSPDLS